MLHALVLLLADDKLVVAMSANSSTIRVAQERIVVWGVVILMNEFGFLLFCLDWLQFHNDKMVLLFFLL